jgi:hypothetical protein
VNLDDLPRLEFAEWRAAHEEYWPSAEMREVLGQPEFTVDDETAVLARRFRLVAA